ncbi:homeobox protein transcription factor [Anaeramoeba flamelloides]|uniref:Homeobox protein transcription factor n=1 Tax=Anaeramoeba flamelloides TaxID=1746091 RepID=A0ABQ8XDH6_9EUKA|nr:homeobox protein transcription factor [Anaeramoeba flamelloides]
MYSNSDNYEPIYFNKNGILKNPPNQSKNNLMIRQLLTNNKFETLVSKFNEHQDFFTEEELMDQTETNLNLLCEINGISFESLRQNSLKQDFSIDIDEYSQNIKKKKKEKEKEKEQEQEQEEKQKEKEIDIEIEQEINLNNIEGFQDSSLINDFIGEMIFSLEKQKEASNKILRRLSEFSEQYLKELDNLDLDLNLTTQKKVSLKKASQELKETLKRQRSQEIQKIGAKSRRKNYPKNTRRVLNKWFFDHLEKPFPTKEEKQELSLKTSLTIKQISTWFTNARRRKLKQMREKIDLLNISSKENFDIEKILVKLGLEL